MKKTIAVPEGVTVEKHGSLIVVTGPKGSLERQLSSPMVEISIHGNEISVESKGSRRRVQAMTGTFASHIRNMIIGVQSGYEARMKVVYSHFPMKLKVESGRLVIQNFMGERSSRTVEIPEGVAVEAKKEEVIVSGPSKEAVGQTAGRIEGAATVRGFDRRIFQDGIHLVQKAREAS
jgi:large subunit ribosomal protein L6